MVTDCWALPCSVEELQAELDRIGEEVVIGRTDQREIREKIRDRISTLVQAIKREETLPLADLETTVRAWWDTRKEKAGATI